MITFDHVSYEVEGRTIIDDVSFCIEAGEFVSFVGTNRAGEINHDALDQRVAEADLGMRAHGRSADERDEIQRDRPPRGLSVSEPDRQICCNTVHEELMFGFMAQKADPDVARRRGGRHRRAFRLPTRCRALPSESGGHGSCSPWPRSSSASPRWSFSTSPPRGWIIGNARRSWRPSRNFTRRDDHRHGLP